MKEFIIDQVAILVTNNLNGCTYEPWFKKLKGEDLIDFVDNKRDEVVTVIVDKLFETKETKEKKEDCEEGWGDISV